MGALTQGMQNDSYYAYASRGQVFNAFAAVTAPVIYTTAAGTGGPLLWNGSGIAGARAVNAVLLGLTCALTVASAVAAALGITGNKGQTAAPSATTPITASGNCFVGGAAPQCNVYSVGTVANAGNFFLPLIQLGTSAITAVDEFLGFIDLQGLIVVPPGSWASVAASATATSAVGQIGLIWAEVPL